MTFVNQISSYKDICAPF